MTDSSEKQPPEKKKFQISGGTVTDSSKKQPPEKEEFQISGG